MLKKFSFLTGMPFAGILMVLLIIAMAVATFVESSLGTSTAWAIIYDTWWFELLFALVVINLVGNIIRFKLYRRSKLTVFVFHAAFILIIIGGGITRYFSENGMMRIREGNTASKIVSDKTYMDVIISDGENSMGRGKQVRLTPLTPRDFKWKGRFNDQRFTIRSVGFLSNATPQYVASPGGKPYVQLVLLTDRQYRVGIADGEVARYPGVSVSLNQPAADADILLFSSGNQLFTIAKDSLIISSMGSSEAELFVAGDTVVIEQGKLITSGPARLVMQRLIPSAKMNYVERENGMPGSGMNVVKMEIDFSGMRKEVFVPGMKNNLGEPVQASMGNVNFNFVYGSHEIDLPFMLKLNDFLVERYPGSNSPSSFESKVILLDKSRGITEERRIYMNNVLKHRGYRFYQSSYDQDERGTILSVKKDVTGTAITYVGYFFLLLGMFLALFSRGTRFSRLVKSTNRKVGKAATIVAVLLISTTVHAQQYPTPEREDGKAFGKLWVQGKEGRFKPINTLSNEVVRKITGSSSLPGKTNDQVLLGMVTYPDQWKSIPLFEVEHAELHEMLGFKGSRVSFNDFVTEQGGYLLSEPVNQAYQKRVQDRTELDKEIMKLDERINILYLLQNGELLKIFPDLQDTTHAWYSVAELLESGTHNNDTLGQVFLVFTHALRDGDRELATEIISFIDRYQQKSTHVLPSESRKRAEILYNRIDIFKRLFRFYIIFGFTLIILQYFRIFRPAKWVEYMFRIGIIHLAAGFVLHTAALALRWYISGYAPMSNGYESMVFVSWVSLLAGLIFVRRTGFALALTAILSALTLLVAHMSWMNPEITNLVPVLKSPWLTIHVSVIMAGYGFLGLSAMSGLTNLVFYIVQRSGNRNTIESVINQLTRVNHLSVIIGLYFLTAGVFLGGIWANESWGRYWGWDPKETWALISVLVYSFITHMHNFPGMRGGYAFNLASVAGFGSILMTYFGVNYFLGGIHSYAGGAAFQIPWFVYFSVVVLFVLALVAYNRQKKLKIDYLEESDNEAL